MKHFEEYLKNIEYQKQMYSIYGSWLKDHLGNNEMFFNTFLSLCFENSYSYYSVVCHERYIKQISTKKCFVWRNGDNYKFEFSDEQKVSDVIRSVLDEVPVKQIDALTIEMPFISKSLITKINDTYFK